MFSICLVPRLMRIKPLDSPRLNHPFFSSCSCSFSSSSWLQACYFPPSPGLVCPEPGRRRRWCRIFFSTRAHIAWQPDKSSPRSVDETPQIEYWVSGDVPGSLCLGETPSAWCNRLEEARTKYNITGRIYHIITFCPCSFKIILGKILSIFKFLFRGKYFYYIQFV